jgi:hypothetical protein
MASKLWVRLGDQGDYEAYELPDSDGLEHVAALFAELGVGPLRRIDKYSVTDDRDYAGLNYISVFIGDADAQPLRGLTRREFEELRELTAMAVAEAAA